MSERRREPGPVDVDAVPVVVAGTAMWAVGLVVCVVLRDRLGDDGRSWWTAACAWGVGLGLFGLLHCVRRRAAIAGAEADEPNSHSA